MKETSLMLENPYYSYLLGLFQTDGHLYLTTRNRGRITVELGTKDEDLLLDLQARLPFNSSVRRRSRRTNFSDSYGSSVWTICDKRFRDFMISSGMPSGRKSCGALRPLSTYCSADYFRRVIDGDGSLGFTAVGLPFLSFVTSSSELAAGFLKFIEEVTGIKKTAKRNKRDSVFNIVLFKELAQRVAKALYYESCIGMPRKARRAREVLGWVRPKEMKKVVSERWTPQDDSFVLTNSVIDSVQALNRSRKSVEMRRFRLRSNSK